MQMQMMRQPEPERQQAEQNSYSAEENRRQIERQREEELEAALRLKAARLHMYSEAFDEYIQSHWPFAKPSDKLLALSTFLSQLTDPVDEDIVTALRGIVRKTILAFGPPTVPELQSLCDAAARKWFGLTRAGAQLQGARVSLIDINSAPPAVLAKIGAATQFLSARWSSSVALENQAILSVHADPDQNRTYIHIGCTKIGSILIEIPRVLTPQEAARLALAALAPVFETMYGTANPIIVVDGDHVTLNFKQILPRHAVLRSRTADAMSLIGNVDRIMNIGALTTANTAILSGLPRSREGLDAVFGADRADWTTWQGVADQWLDTAERSGFPVRATTENSESAGKETIMRALAEKQNVIVLTAHAEGGRVHFPDPPPQGSLLTMEDIQSLEFKIRDNRPIVYLFCCEAARISGLDSLAGVLLKAGAAGVVAPQASIEATGRTLKLFETFLVNAKTTGPVEALTKAERSTGSKELETWIG